MEGGGEGETEVERFEETEREEKIGKVEDEREVTDREG
jgi:hypothetical protein